MFTGLVERTGRLVQVHATDAGRELRIESGFTDLAAGESIAVNGVCLTVREFGRDWFIVAAIVTTLGRSTIGEWQAGRTLNLERALRMGDRLGGHMVQGHVDGVATVTAVADQGDARLVTVAIPDEVAELCVLHGSITIDGVSLTVNDIPAPGRVQVALIEYTLRHTTLGMLAEGDVVHVEGDMIGKYVRQLLVPHQERG